MNRPELDRSNYLRQQDIQKVFDTYICASRVQSLLITGSSKSGKTSFLSLVGSEACQRQYIDDLTEYLFVSLRARPDYSEPRDFFAEVLPRLGVSEWDDWNEAFSDRMKRAVEDEQKVILLIDDFQNLSQNERIPLDFYSFLRAMANENPLAMFLTGPKRLFSTVAIDALPESPFFNIFNSLSLDAVPEDEALGFLERGLVEIPGEERRALAEWGIEQAGLLPYPLAVFLDSVKGLDSAALASQKNKKRVVAQLKDEIGDFVFDTFSEIDDNLKERFTARLHSSRAGELSRPETRQLRRFGLVRHKGGVYDIASPVYSEILKERTKPPKRFVFW